MLFLNLMYDENFNMTTFKLSIDLNEFNKLQQNIIVYADLKRFL